MKVLIIGASFANMEKVIEIAQKKVQNTDITFIIRGDHEKNLTNEEIRRSAIDFLISFNLYGFEKSTLTDGIAYNLLDCKQIHILLESKLANEQYLAKQLTIAMFFYCADIQYCQLLLKKYPDIPYLKTIERWNNGCSQKELADNADILCDILYEVMEICHLNK